MTQYGYINCRFFLFLETINTATYHCSVFESGRLWEHQHGQIGSRSVMLHIINKHVHEASNQKTQHNTELLCPQNVLHTFSGNWGLICLCTMYSLQWIMMLSQWEWRNCTIAQASTLISQSHLNTGLWANSNHLVLCNHYEIFFKPD